MSELFSRPENSCTNTYDSSAPKGLQDDTDLARPENELPNSSSSGNIGYPCGSPFVDLNSPITGYPQIYPDGKGGDIVKRSGHPNADVTPTKDGGYTVSYTDKNGQPSTEAESYTMTPDHKGGSTYTFKRPDGSVDITLQSTSHCAEDIINPETSISGVLQTFARAALGRQNYKDLQVEAAGLEFDRLEAKYRPH